jgi:Holliday junction resolvase RusA-like endonuclease
MRVRLIVQGRPVPLQRSRTSSGHHYLPKRSRLYRDTVQAVWLEAGRPSLGDAPFTLSARFIGANPRADLDNLCKAILDALNGLGFTDDSQLVCIAGAHKLPTDADGARTEVELWSAGDSVIRAYLQGFFRIARQSEILVVCPNR